MRRTVVAVALAVLVVLAGCSAININRPADNGSNETDAPGGPGAPTTTDGQSDETGDDESDSTDQAARGETETGTDDASDAESAATATPVPETLSLTNEGEQDYLVEVTVTNGPIEAVKLAKPDGSTDIVVLEEQSLDSALSFDTVDVQPIEVVEANSETEVDPGESLTAELPGDTRRYVLVEVHVDDDEEPTVIGATTLSCSLGENVVDVSVTTDGEDVDVTSECAA